MVSNEDQILLIGGSGQLGWYLWQGLSNVGSVVSTSRRTGSQDGLYYDASKSFSGLDFSDWKLVVYAAGLSSVSDCERRMALSERVNFVSPVEVAREVSKSGGHFVFVSSSAANEYQAMSVEQARESHCRGDVGASAYGLHKYLAEQELLKLENTLVLRLSKVALPNWKLLRHWVSRLQVGGEIEAFDDHFISPISIAIIVQAFTAVSTERANGIIEISAQNQCSYVEAARMLAQELGQSENLITPTSAASVLDGRHIFRHAVLNSQRAEKLLGFRMPLALDVLKPYALIK